MTPRALTIKSDVAVAMEMRQVKITAVSESTEEARDP